MGAHGRGWHCHRPPLRPISCRCQPPISVLFLQGWGPDLRREGGHLWLSGPDPQQECPTRIAGTQGPTGPGKEQSKHHPSQQVTTRRMECNWPCARPCWSLSIQDPHETSLCLSEEAVPTPDGTVEAPEAQRGREPIPYLGLTLTLLTSGIVGPRSSRASQTPYVSRAQGTVTYMLHVCRLLTPAPLSRNTRHG